MKGQGKKYANVCNYIKDEIRVEKNESKLNEKNKEIINKLNKIINKISKKVSEDVVYIFQQGFFDPRGEQFYSGGAERYVLDLASLLQTRGIKVVLIQYGDSENESPWIRTKNQLIVIGVNCNKIDYTSIINKLSRPLFAIYSGFTYFGNDVYDNSLVISHGITWDVPSRNCNVFMIKRILDSFATVISVDTNTISWFRSTFSSDLKKQGGEKFKFIPNYVDRNVFFEKKHENKRSIRILFPRRLCPERGFELFCNVITNILDDFPTVEVELAGFVHGNDIQEKLDYLQGKYGNRIMHSVVPANKMVEVYQRADISIIPTLYSEGTSLSCLEAMACGNCVISTNVGGLPNLIIDGFNGLLINPNENELKNSIIYVLSNKEKMNKIRENAIKVADNFSKEKWDNSWNLLFDDIIARYGTKSH